MTEIEALSRLREGGIDSLVTKTRDWQEYESYLNGMNEAVWTGVLAPLREVSATRGLLEQESMKN
jgi:hypothetical protein